MKMAGTIGATTATNSIFQGKIPPYKPHTSLRVPSEIRHLHASYGIKSPRSIVIFFAMAEEVNHNNHSAEVKEPPSKIQKVDSENGIVQAPVPFFRVKKLSDKAILPSRATLHSAGYDLSR